MPWIPGGLTTESTRVSQETQLRPRLEQSRTNHNPPIFRDENCAPDRSSSQARAIGPRVIKERDDHMNKTTLFRTAAVAAFAIPATVAMAAVPSMYEEQISRQIGRAHV